MRKLYIGNGDKQFKFADTTTEIHLNAFDDGSASNLANDAKVRIKNNSGYLLEISASITDNQAVITSGQLAQLPVGSYLIELWDTVNGGTAIYPSDGFLALQINENATGLSGGLVSSITVDDFIQQFSSLSEQLKQEVADAIANGLKGDKGDDGLSAYQVAVINGYQGSQAEWLASLIGDKGDKGDTGTVDNTGLTTAPAFVNLQNQVNNSAVGANLLTGTNNDLTTVTNATNWNSYLPTYSPAEPLKANQTYTVSCYLEPATHDAAVCMNTASGSAFGTTIAAGSEGISTLTITLTQEDVEAIRNCWITFTTPQTDNTTVSYMGFKLELGSHATDWCPNPSEILTQSNYEKTALGIFYKSGEMVTVETGAPYDDLNTFPIGQTVTIAETPDRINQIKNLPSISNTTGGLTVRTESSVNDTIGAFQIAIDNNNFMYHRICWGASGQWGTWKSDSADENSNNPLSYWYSGSFNDLPLGTVMASADTMTDGPDTIHGFTTTTFYSSQWNGRKAQIAIADNVNLMYFRVGGYFGTSTEMSWNSWVLLSDDSKVVHKVDEYSNNSILPTLSLFQKVGVVGDSYASGELAFDGQYADHYEISWLQILARKDGFTGTNFSKGGMSTRTWLTDSKCMPLMQSSDAQDLYILALGINDETLGNSYIGSEADINSGADTFYGNYGKIIKAIQAKAPQAKIVIATIANNSDIAAKLNEAITTIANHFNIPVIVQLDDSLFNSSFYKDTMIGGHPTGPVYASMAEAFERLIGQSMIDNLDYYKTFKKDA